jgi:hypothetical protein
MFRERYLRRAGLTNFDRSSSFAGPRRTVVIDAQSSKIHLTGEENVIGFDALNITMLR